MVFGSSDAVKAALDVRDGLGPSMLEQQRHDGVDGGGRHPGGVERPRSGGHAVHDALECSGQASQVTDYDTVKKRLLGSRYTMDFSNGVKFNLAVLTPDAFTPALWRPCSTPPRCTRR